MPDSSDSLDWDIPFDTGKPSKTAPAPLFKGVSSFGRLIAVKRVSGDLASFKRKALAMKSWDTQDLILRVATATDPLSLLALHVILGGRNVPPALRWPGNTSSDQMLLVSWCADLAWFVKRNSAHTPRFKSWQRLLKFKPWEPRWLEVAYQLFDRMHGRSLSHITAKALGLSDIQRQDLMTLPTVAMVKARRALHPDKMEVVRQGLLSQAMAHPDKSGELTPEAVAYRRAAIWRSHILMGERPTETAKAWALLTGHPITRQIISKQIAITGEVLRTMRKFE